MARFFRHTFTVLVGVLALMYLAAPSFIPDFIPFVGWLDEGVATTVLLSVLNFYGIDLTHLLGRNPQEKEKALPTPSQAPQQKRAYKIPKRDLEGGTLTPEQLQRYEQVILNEEASQR